MTGPAPSGRADRIALGSCLAAALVLRLWNLGAPDLWSDEVHTLDAMGLPVGDLVAERLRAGHLPLYFVLLRGWTELFGTSQLALRFPSALLGTALVVPAFALFRRLLPAAQARWALAVLAVHPTFVELSREARMYPLLGLAFLVLAEGAVAATDGGRVPLRFWVAAAVGPFVHATWGLAVLPLAAFVWIESLRAPAPPDRPHAGRAAAAGMLASVVVLGALLLAATPQTQALDRRPWPAEAFVFAVRTMTGSALSGPDRLVAGAALISWACCLAVALHRCRGRVQRFVLWNVLGTQAAVLLVGVLGGFPVGPVRYHHLAAIGLCAAAATALGWAREQCASIRTELRGSPDAPAHWIDRRYRRRTWPVATAAVSVASPVALAVVLASGAVFRAATPDTPWSSLAVRVARQVPHGETIHVDDDGARTVGEHYLGRSLTVGFPEDSAAWWHAGLREDRPGEGFLQHVTPGTEVLGRKGGGLRWEVTPR